jgi:hypothetical protein
MAITLPTDGQGVYESIAPSLGSATYQPRLDQIAAGGFQLVLNYGLLFGSIAQITAYINYAASKGLKVIVAIHNPVIWDTVANPTSAALAAEYATLYAAAGSPTSNWDSVFTSYVVNQLKGLAGVWGWYLGDEVVNSQHAAMVNHAGFVHSADSTHPRLIIEQGSGANSVASGTSLFFDCCDAMGDDYYQVGAAAGVYTRTTAQQASAVQTFCTGKGIASAMVLQAHSFSAYAPFPSVYAAPWPTEAQMQQARSDALSNMTPRVLLWYSYFDAINQASPDFAPALQWSFLQWASTGKSGIAMFPNATRRGYRR